ncbi:MAG: bifunctional 5,10-methylene-tetrahydrofolate dehydrogenase/5,10-methylene-tetrahydrofolate cyclohydrolase [Bacteroidetes bacterium]|nr:bifunctional 5,10-methylene-tetrahydrofolate dehydrogenase/5,10-methylene-tetrahydrofolate cyclohydrolase [Bacteroidota bacterium]
MTIIDGKSSAEEYKSVIRQEVAALKARGLRAPHLAVMLIGNNGASETYVANKMKTCQDVGFNATLIRYENTVSEREVLHKINEINHNPEIDGLIVQSPFPNHISPQKVNEAIHPAKDVDGFHPVNAGRLQQNKPCYVAATPKGIMQLIERYKIETQGKHCVIVGRSNIVGMPMSILMSRNARPGNCTVTVCHSKTVNLAQYTLQADILIAATGVPEMITASMVKDGAVIIDVGITRVPDVAARNGFRLRGDVKFDEVAPKCSFITPVPGGVGPMTIIGLLQNTLLAAKHAIYN